MLAFVQNWFTCPSNPIGVDFGTDSLRLAQVELAADREFRLVAAASADVPTLVRNDSNAKFAFLTQTLRDLLGQGNFRGRRVMLNLPSWMMHTQHMRLPKMDDEALKKALAWEARGKLPFDPSQAVLRHLIAGEIYHDQEPKYEVVLMAARRDLVEQYLQAASKARVQVVGMTVEPKAIVDCFSHVFRRKSDTDTTVCYLDIGCCATRAVIARNADIRFARTIPIGGEHFSRAAASALDLPLENARLLRLKLVQESMSEQTADGFEEVAVTPAASPEAALEGSGFALLNAGVAAAQQSESSGRTALAVAPPETAVAVAEAAPEERPAATVSPLDRKKIEEAAREPLMRLVEELSLCRRYHEATFPNEPVQRLVFVGAEAHQRKLCQQVAQELGVSAQVGDPLVRMNRHAEAGIETEIDRRSPQPQWAVALGLSMGPRLAQAQQATE